MIHAQAVIDPRAQLDENVQVGAFTVIEGAVRLEAGVKVGPHVVIQGPTHIGQNTEIAQFASIGGAPQDKQYRGEETRLEIGENNIIREYCTINRGSTHGTQVTRVGNHNFIMATCHIAHDCQIGNHCIFANGASLAGHVIVEDFAILSGFVLVHQFCRIGGYSFSAMGCGIAKDVPPFMMVAGEPAIPRGLNIEGLRRRHFSKETILKLRKAYKILYKSKLKLDEALVHLKVLAEDCIEVTHLINFIAASSRSIVR